MSSTCLVKLAVPPVPGSASFCALSANCSHTSTSGGEKNRRGFNRHRCFTHHENESLEHSHVFPMENQWTERTLKQIGKECVHHRIDTRSGGYLASGEPSPTSGVSTERKGRKTTRCMLQIALLQHSRLLTMRL